MDERKMQEWCKTKSLLIYDLMQFQQVFEEADNFSERKKENFIVLSKEAIKIFECPK